MRIAIIGGGWIGCHLGYTLRNLHNVTIFEENESLFGETSYKNQNRLHYGYHYPRSYKTREMCKNTYNQFISDYGFILSDVPKNLYCIPKEKSIVDFNTYKHIFNDYGFEESDLILQGVEGCINTNEKYINHDNAKSFFNEKLSDITTRKKITKDNLKELSKEFDLVINATNNMLKLSKDDSFFELTISLVYEKISETIFDSITLMDGKFFSIYPYGNGKYTLTDVEYTPIKRFSNPTSLNRFKSKIDSEQVNELKGKMESKVIQYYPDFHKNFKYSNYFLSTKCKLDSGSDDRYPVIKKEGNIVSCYTGKIQGIYIISNYINNLILDYEGTNR